MTVELEKILSVLREKGEKLDFVLSEEEGKVASVIGLPEDPSKWTSDDIRAVYERWQKDSELGIDGISMIERDAELAGVGFQDAHKVHDCIAAASTLFSLKSMRHFLSDEKVEEREVVE